MQETFIMNSSELIESTAERFGLEMNDSLRKFAKVIRKSGGIPESPNHAKEMVSSGLQYLSKEAPDMLLQFVHIPKYKKVGEVVTGMHLSEVLENLRREGYNKCIDDLAKEAKDSPDGKATIRMEVCLKPI